MGSLFRLPPGAVLLVVLASGCGGGGSPTTSNTGGCTMTEEAVPNEGWVHVLEGSSIAYQHNPPASGPHYPVWLRYEAFSTTMARGYWVHNLEHGAIVLLYRPDVAPALSQAVLDTYRALPTDPACGHSRALVTPDPLLNRPLAVVAANFVLSGECVDQAAVNRFTTTHRGRAPEDICEGGQRP